MAEPDFVATLSERADDRATFRIHCFRQPPSDDARLTAWLFGRIVCEAARSHEWCQLATAHPALEAALTQRSLSAWQTLPRSFSAEVDGVTRRELPPLDWDDITTDGGFDGRALPHFELTMRIVDGAVLLASLPSEKVAFECRERIDDLEFVDPRLVPERPEQGLVPLLSQVPRGLDIPWPTDGWVPGPVSGHRWGLGPEPKRGKTECAIVWVVEEGLREGVAEHGWIDRRGSYPELKAFLAELMPEEHGPAADVDGVVRAGDDGVAEAGPRGAAVAGERGTATVGNHGSATVGNHGSATAGMKGTAIAGDFGAAVAGHMGKAIAGRGGRAEVGRLGEARAGIGGRVSGGKGAKLSVEVSEGKVERVVAGETIEPGLLYRFEPEKGWVRAYS